jgi:hypothetical protein
MQLFADFRVQLDETVIAGGDLESIARVSKAQQEVFRVGSGWGRGKHVPGGGVGFRSGGRDEPLPG